MAVKRHHPPQALSESRVLEQLRNPEGKSLDELLRTLRLAAGRSARRRLREILRRLRHRRLIEAVGRGRFRAVSSERARSAERSPRARTFVGRVVAHRDGYAFVVPRDPIGIQGDLFVPPHQVGDAMHGDEVLACIERRRPDGRAEGRILQVLHRAHPAVVGVFHARGKAGGVVVPFDARIPHEILIPPESAPPAGAPAGSGSPWRALDGAAVNVELTRFPRHGLAPTGRVVEVLGRPGEVGVEVEIIVRKHHLPHRFPPEVLEQAATVAPVVLESARVGRRDFRHLPIVTIDGETARDFDDAVYVERLAGGGYLLQVHIADVAHYVPRGSPLDQEARVRGTSVYFPDRAIPMLPEALSNGICSLRPGEDRLVVSVLMHCDRLGRVVDTEFALGVIRSAARMTYTAVDRILDGDPATRQHYASLVDQFLVMKELALLLYERRRSRGAIDFDLPEPVIEFDALGRILTISRSQRTMANRIIEEFMLAANEQVARYLGGRGLPMLHRVHEPPDPAKVLEFEELARAFGYSLGIPGASERTLRVRHGRREGGQRAAGRARPLELTTPAAFAVRPQHYQRLVEKIAGKPEERILSYLMLRSLKQARYAAEPLGHFALATMHYTHFTSPIRRYPDLVVHRLLKWALAHPQDPPEAAPYQRPELEEIAAESSEAERRADEAERELTAWKTAQFMEQHLGEEYEALIVSVQKFGFFVELLEIFVEGLVPVRRLEELYGEHFVFRSTDHALASRHHRFRLGQRLLVRAERIDPFLHRVEFAPVLSPAGPARAAMAARS